MALTAAVANCTTAAGASRPCGVSPSGAHVTAWKRSSRAQPLLRLLGHELVGVGARRCSCRRPAPRPARPPAADGLRVGALVGRHAFELRQLGEALRLVAEAAALPSATASCHSLSSCPRRSSRSSPPPSAAAGRPAAPSARASGGRRSASSRPSGLIVASSASRSSRSRIFSAFGGRRAGASGLRLSLRHHAAQLVQLRINGRRLVVGRRSRPAGSSGALSQCAAAWSAGGSGPGAPARPPDVRHEERQRRLQVEQRVRHGRLSAASDSASVTVQWKPRRCAASWRRASGRETERGRRRCPAASRQPTEG